jgi:hypothetical protein
VESWAGRRADNETNAPLVEHSSGSIEPTPDLFHRAPGRIAASDVIEFD